MHSSEFSRRPSPDQLATTSRGLGESSIGGAQPFQPIPAPPDRARYPQPPYHYQPAVHHPQGTNGFAITALVLGILGFLGLAILALVFGYVGRAQIRRRGQSGKGLAIAGIVLGWVWVGLFTVHLLLAGAAAV